MSTAAQSKYSEFMAEYYDATPLYQNRADVAFYVDCARQARGRVLELGCGTGRVLLPTAEEGREITGLDISATMLARCREKVAKLLLDFLRSDPTARPWFVSAGAKSTASLQSPHR